MLKHDAPNGVRTALLALMPKDGIVAEVGVLHGRHAYQMYKINSPRKLYLIDCWRKQYGTYHKDPVNKTDFVAAYKAVARRFSKFDNVEILIMDSVPAAAKFADEYFDWVYIDANHTYSGISADLNDWWPKIKRGGYLAGHYYGDRDWSDVQRAVDEFADRWGLPVGIADANDSSKMPEWYLQKSW